MQDIYYNNILDEVNKFVPEFQTIFDKEDIYPFMFEFGQFIIENFQNEEILGRSVRFINDALKTSSTLIEDLIVIQIFQQIYSDKKLLIRFKDKLSIQGNIIFDKYYVEYKKYYS